MSQEAAIATGCFVLALACVLGALAYDLTLWLGR